jgi:hypothetical protein
MKCAIGSSTRETIRTSPTFRRERLSTIDAAKLGSSALDPCAENRFADEQFVPRRGACGAPCPEHVSAVWLTCWLAAPIPVHPNEAGKRVFAVRQCGQSTKSGIAAPPLAREAKTLPFWDVQLF